MGLMDEHSIGCLRILPLMCLSFLHHNAIEWRTLSSHQHAEGRVPFAPAQFPISCDALCCLCTDSQARLHNHTYQSMWTDWSQWMGRNAPIRKWANEPISKPIGSAFVILSGSWILILYVLYPNKIMREMLIRIYKRSTLRQFNIAMGNAHV